MNFNLLSYYGSALGVATGVIVFIVFLAVAIEIALIIVTVKIAKKKGKNPTGWGWLTFFIGPIALVILLCISDNNNTNMWVCRNCSSINSFGTHCAYCGASRFATKKKTTIEPPKPWTCPKCGYSNNPNATKCINCYNDKP